MNWNVLLDPMLIVLVLGLGLLLPWSAVREFRKLRQALAEGVPDARVRHYRESILFEWLAVVVLLVWWLADGRPLEVLRMGFAPVGAQWWAVAAGLVVCLLLALQAIVLIGRPQSLARFAGSLGELAPMVPRDAREQRYFDALSVTAGICEEILYRGLLLAVLTPVAGLWPAVLVSSLVFGLGHAYQGLAGFMKVSVVGMGFALLTVFSGSLLPAIAAHIALDLTSGRLMRVALANMRHGQDGEQTEPPDDAVV